VVFICLNTLLFTAHWSGAEQGSTVPWQQLTWLEETLADARSKGKKVWLLMHVPPGADVYGTVNTYMDETGRISDARMMWERDYQERFMEITRTYREVIEAGFAGHTHMDEYLVSRPGDKKGPGIILITPGISPVFGNNPAFKVFTMSHETWELLDYRSMTYFFGPLTEDFVFYYLFSKAYSMETPLEPSLVALISLLPVDTILRERYTRFYYSGHDEGNKINDINWPAYWCAMGNMDKEDYIDCVNGYR